MISEQEVYNVLTYHWQATQEIRRRVAGNKGLDKLKINAGTLHSRLAGLVIQEFAEMRERKPKGEECVKRRGYKVGEYRKVSGRKPAYDEAEVQDELKDLGLVTA